MSQPIDTDPGPVPDHDVDEVLPTLDERLTELTRRAREAQDLAGWANPETAAGRGDLAHAAVELGRCLGELVGVIRGLERSRQ